MPLPCTERLGLVWVVAQPAADRVSADHDWDANLKGYHFAYAHRATIAPLLHDNLVLHDRFGEHHRILLPKQNSAELSGPPETLAGYGRALNIIYFFFPCNALLWEGDHVNPSACSQRGRTPAT